MPEQQRKPEHKGREGGRWVNERPSAQEFAEWFTASMKLDPSLQHTDYIGGVVLIPTVDSNARYVTGFTNDGAPIIEKREELIFTPYAKVESRIDYYWDLLDAHPEWVGVVEHVESPRLPIDTAIDMLTQIASMISEGWSAEIVAQLLTLVARPSALTQMTHQLPEGFSLLSVPVGDRFTHFACCTIRVSIYDREKYEADPKTAVARRTGRGTKQVPLIAGRQQIYADPSSLMKAETGALGRALGFAGIFVIPGSGVATAEDMMEALTQGQPAASEESAGQGPSAPAEPPVRTDAERGEDETDELRQRAEAMWRELRDDHPERATEFGLWARQRRLQSLGDARGAMLRGVVRKMETLLDDAKQAPDSAGHTESGAAPALEESALGAEGDKKATEEGGDVPSQAAGAVENQPDE